jgi:four helix bundle protein
MDNKKFSLELERRTRKFAVQIIKLAARLPNTPEGRVVRTQITKAGSSVGANYREANRARSKADFRNKIRISEGEANESLFWREVIRDIGWLSWKEIKSEYEESSELHALFTSIGRGAT